MTRVNWVGWTVHSRAEGPKFKVGQAKYTVLGKGSCSQILFNPKN